MLRSAKRYAVVLVICLILFYGLQVWLTGGILKIPPAARFLRKFDNLEQVKTWSSFKEEHRGLDPITWVDPTRPSNILPEVSLDVNLPSFWEQLLYPTDVAVFHVLARTSSADGELQFPSTLILVLDENEHIRGKLYVQFLTRDYSITQTGTVLEFWFRFPPDMRDRPYHLVVEQFGSYILEGSIQTGSSYPQQFLTSDRLYGQIPFVNPTSLGENPFRFYALARTLGRAPSTSLINPVDLAFRAAAVTSGTIFVFLVRFSRELWEYHKKHKEICIYETFCFLTLVVFLFFLWSIVYSRF
jgi:hypothetical protein